MWNLPTEFSRELKKKISPVCHPYSKCRPVRPAPPAPPRYATGDVTGNQQVDEKRPGACVRACVRACVCRRSHCTRKRSVIARRSWPRQHSSLPHLNASRVSLKRITIQWGRSVLSVQPSYWRSPTSVAPSASVHICSGLERHVRLMDKRSVTTAVLLFLTDLFFQKYSMLGHAPRGEAV